MDHTSAGPHVEPVARPIAESIPEGATPEGFVQLYRDEYRSLVRIAYLILGSQEQAEEVAQDAFVKLHDRWAHVDNPGAYVRSSVVNGCRDIRRRLVRYRARQHRLIGPTETVDAPDELFDALARLTVRQRAVVVLRFYGSMQEAEIAEALGVKVGTVKSSLHRGIQRLREELTHDT